jgi:hypothetical protein
LFQVNDETCEQVIYCTPKLSYPFDKNGKFNWPPINQLEIYEKEDGTNILAFHYKHNNTTFTTFKTRLSPILADMTFGKFKSMWEEYRTENYWVEEVIKLNPEFNLSFELYGSRNPITIVYPEPLEVALLFGIRREDGAIRPPTQLRVTDNTRVPEYLMMNEAAKEMFMDEEVVTKEYNHQRAVKSALNSEGILWDEGAVFYVHTGKPSWKMFKCKPEEIEKIHWAASGYIPKVALWNTLINAFESEDDPSREYIKELLLEEYTEQQIYKSIPRIQKLYDEVKRHLKMVSMINDVWFKAKEMGFDVKKDKAATFRFMSQFFKRDEMKKVASVVLKQAGLL